MTENINTFGNAGGIANSRNIFSSILCEGSSEGSTKSTSSVMEFLKKVLVQKNEGTQIKFQDYKKLISEVVDANVVLEYFRRDFKGIIRSIENGEGKFASLSAKERERMIQVSLKIYFSCVLEQKNEVLYKEFVTFFPYYQKLIYSAIQDSIPWKIHDEDFCQEITIRVLGAVKRHYKPVVDLTTFIKNTARLISLREGKQSDSVSYKIQKRVNEIKTLLESRCKDINNHKEQIAKMLIEEGTTESKDLKTVKRQIDIALNTMQVKEFAHDPLEENVGVYIDENKIRNELNTKILFDQILDIITKEKSDKMTQTVQYYFLQKENGFGLEILADRGIKEFTVKLTKNRELVLDVDKLLKLSQTEYVKYIQTNIFPHISKVTIEEMVEFLKKKGISEEYLY